jgi:cyclophilin family peptidyl-prolyl cis-trans isomerase
MGTIVFEMYYDHAPRTCKNFVELVWPFSNLQCANDSRLGEDITME